MCRNFRAQPLLFILFVVSIIGLLPRETRSQCSLVDNSRDALFITFEKETPAVTGEAGGPGILVRLTNNSSCDVLITSGRAEKFFKSVPPGARPAQMIKGGEIDYTLPDNVFVPDVQYQYGTPDTLRKSAGGDMFFGFKLLGRHSLLFDIPYKHLDMVPGAVISLVFEYAWERENRAKVNYGTVENTVTFWPGELPDKVVARIRKKRGH